jgi:hypothetical protein
MGQFLTHRGFFVFENLLLDDGLVGAFVEAAQALDAQLLVDDVLAVTFRNRPFGADVDAGTALDAFVGDDDHDTETSSFRMLLAGRGGK